MAHDDDISDDLNRRIDGLAARSSLTRRQIIEAALLQGRSLAWQENWAAGVQAGIAEAERGDVVGSDEIAAVLGKFGPA